MAQGYYDVLLIRNIHLNHLVQFLDATLHEAEFYSSEKQWHGPVLRGKSIWGSRSQAYVYSAFVPFGSLMKKGNRYGAEFEVYQTGPNVILKLLLVPYMILFDRKDIFLLSQGFFEKMVDDEQCHRFLLDLVNRLRWKGLTVEPYRGQR